MSLFSYATQYDADKNGYFGPYGGRYVPESLIRELDRVNQVYEEVKKDPKFEKEFLDLLKNFVGRPSPLIYAENLTNQLGGAKIYLKNEGANLTGAHKINHCLGQGLIAKRMGKKLLIAETGAGQHGVATATIAAKLGMRCIVFMGSTDIERQQINVQIMEMLGAEVRSVDSGSRTLKDAVNAALKYWISHSEEGHYVLGSCLGPHPYPSMNRDFQQIVGLEAREQILEREKRLPDYVIACVGGGSNAMGIFYRFLEDENVQLIGVEAGGSGVLADNQHASRLTGAANARVGIFHGYKSYFLQDTDGNISPTHSVAAGLDYPGVGPQLAYLHDLKRVQFTFQSDKQALSAFQTLAKNEGIIPAFESSHAIAQGLELAPTLSKDRIILINVSGRGDKDLISNK